MNKKILILLLSFTSLIFHLSAQHILCGHDFVMKGLEEQYPGYQNIVKNTFEAAKSNASSPNLLRSSMVYTIPVLVHVVWKDSIENLPDTLIQSQIDVLNQDYRRLNADADNLRPIFEDIVGDAMIEFELMDINRVQTDTEFEFDILGGTLLDQVKVTANGGSDAIEPENHLNIWICNIPPISFGNIEVGQILGYAYPPADLEHWPEGITAPSPELDGVVLDYRVVGRNSPFDIDIAGISITTAGRTATHEIGHYLGLRHIWGDGGDLFGGTDSCEADDGVEDTPNTGAQSNFDCNTNQNSCDDGVDDMPDMIENFMDYAAETCMNSFTNGQIDIMRAVLEGPRCNLVDACMSTNTNEVVSSKLLKAFPNPSADIIHLEMDNYDLKDFDISVRSILGEVLPLNINKNNQELDVSTWSNGVYFIHLQKNNWQLVKKISVTR